MSRLSGFGLGVVFCVFLTVLPLPTTGPADAADEVDAVFSTLYGSWRGRGSFRQAPGKPRESVVCRVSYKKSSSTRVGLNVRCSGADFAIKASGTVIYNPGSKRFRGTLRDRGMGWTMKLSGGVRSKGRLRFSLVIPEAETRGWMSIRTRGRKRHSISVKSSDAKRGKLSETLKISFRR